MKDAPPPYIRVGERPERLCVQNHLSTRIYHDYDASREASREASRAAWTNQCVQETKRPGKRPEPNSAPSLAEIHPWTLWTHQTPKKRGPVVPIYKGTTNKIPEWWYRAECDSPPTGGPSGGPTRRRIDP